MTIPNVAYSDIATEAWADLVADQVNAFIPTAWTAVTFQNSWVNFNVAYQPVQYRKVGDEVQLRGFMSTGTMSAVAFTLPAGFRPLFINLMGTIANSAIAQLAIDPSGTCSPTVGSNAWFSVACRFSVTA